PVQCEPLEITQPEKTVGPDKAGTVKHLEQAVINAENEKDDGKDDFDQNHPFKPRLDRNLFVNGLHNLFQCFDIFDHFLDFLVGELGFGHQVIVTLDNFGARIHDRLAEISRLNRYG